MTMKMTITMVMATLETLAKGIITTIVLLGLVQGKASEKEISQRT